MVNPIWAKLAPGHPGGTVAVWLILAALLLAGCAIPFGPPRPPAEAPAISAQYYVSDGSPQVEVSGLRWQAGSEVFINLRSPDGDLEGTFAVAEARADGQFNITFPYPSGAAWRSLASVVVVARSSASQQQASTILLIPATLPAPAGTQTITATVAVTTPVAPSATPVVLTTPAGQTPASPTAPSTPTPTPDPRLGHVASARVNVRAGPSTAYPILTTVDANTPFVVIGQDASGDWLRIRLDNGLEGWIARLLTDYVALAPVVVAPALPPTATPLPATATPLPLPVITDWWGEYYSNEALAGSPVLIRNDRAIDFNWGRSAPAPGLPEDHFSVRWTRSLEFSRGQYRFTARMDDGMRVFVDGNLVINEWRTGGARDVAVELALFDGVHSLRVEYFEDAGDAVAQLRWERIADQTSFPDWRGEYWGNPNLQGSPAVVHNDSLIDFDWGTGAPAAGLPADNFSVRWTRVVDFPDGTYRFHIRVDDGVRVFVDKNRIIDEWHEHEVDKEYVTELRLGGRHQVTVEYYERSGGASIDLWWEQLAATATPTASPTNTPVPAATDTSVPTNTPAPTNTLPPTATNTPVPTNTAVPTATPSPRPTNTRPPQATATPATDELTIQVEPPSGLVGSNVTVTGQNFPPNTRVNIYIANVRQRQDRERIGSARTGENGNFRTRVEIPRRGPDGEGLSPGPIEVLAIPAGGGVRAIARFTVERANN